MNAVAPVAVGVAFASITAAYAASEPTIVKLSFGNAPSSAPPMMRFSADDMRGCLSGGQTTPSCIQSQSKPVAPLTPLKTMTVDFGKQPTAEEAALFTECINSLDPSNPAARQTITTVLLADPEKGVEALSACFDKQGGKLKVVLVQEGSTQ